MNSFCSCTSRVPDFGMCRQCQWRLTYRWTLLLCLLTSLVYFTLAHFNKLPTVGTFGVSRWWDVLGLVVFVPLTIQVFRATCSTDPEADHWVTGFVLGWLAGLVLFFWKGCLAGFIAMPTSFLAVLGIYYFFQTLSFTLNYIGDRFGWWFGGEARPQRPRCN